MCFLILYFFYFFVTYGKSFSRRNSSQLTDTSETDSFPVVHARCCFQSGSDLPWETSNAPHALLQLPWVVSIWPTHSLLPESISVCLYACVCARALAPPLSLKSYFPLGYRVLKIYERHSGLLPRPARVSLSSGVRAQPHISQDNRCHVYAWMLMQDTHINAHTAVPRPAGTEEGLFLAAVKVCWKLKIYVVARPVGTSAGHHSVYLLPKRPEES